MPQPTLLNNEIRDMLMDCGLFDPLLPEDFHVAAGYFNISNIAQGEVIFLEGDAGTFMCILHSGQVAVQKTNHEGQRVTIATLRSGRAFGEMAVLDGERRSASCLAASDSVLLNLGKDSLEKCSTKPPGWRPRSSARLPSPCPSACAWPTGNYCLNSFNRRGSWVCCRFAAGRAPSDLLAVSVTRSAPTQVNHSPWL